MSSQYRPTKCTNLNKTRDLLANVYTTRRSVRPNCAGTNRSDMVNCDRNMTISVFIMNGCLKILRRISETLIQIIQLSTWSNSTTIFRNKKQHINQELSKLYKLYGPVVTVWVGPIPIVLIGDPDIVKQAFKQRECSGKFQVLLGSIFNDDNHRDVAFNSHLESVVQLRKMTMSTIRKYTKSTDFETLLNTTVDEIFVQMLTKEGIDRPFKPQSYCHELVMNMMNQEMHTNFQYPSHYFGHEMNNLYGIYEFIPIARYFMANPLKKLQQIYIKCFEYTKNELKLRDNNYDESNGRDFCSKFIDAKRRAEAEGKPGFECLNDNNIAAAVMDIDWQQIMRNEVNDRLGDRAPVVADKHHLHNVMAFVYETIRWRNAGPMGAPHMTLSDTILG
ncbi:unnamed protein product [Medioppia subpectinata]|uniref:Cytochrome P450 n=1 Tax=Medioppia subpectinata TaxID=1979941 RepID=A0A7R9Q4R2_9ACAR|nr:unnamed protein product [Medioppia subpectinata]CAG2111634.1 unnamed protein product [Medioppia subpectinata]